MSTQKKPLEFARFDETELAIVEKIVTRIMSLRPSRRTRLDWTMDLAAVSYHTPLRLLELLEADDFNFLHDLCGIANHLDRETGELTDFFVPRFRRRGA